MLKPASGADNSMRRQNRSDGPFVVLHVSHSIPAFTLAFSRLVASCFAISIYISVLALCERPIPNAPEDTPHVGLTSTAYLVSKLISGLASIVNMRLANFSASGAHWER